MKSRAQASLDDILKKNSILMNTLNPPGRVSKTNNNTDTISYDKILIKCITTYNFNIIIPPKLSLKRNFTISYDINATNEFPNMSI